MLESGSKLTADDTSKDMRLRFLSAAVADDGSGERARLPVLRFFGKDNDGSGFDRPRWTSPCSFSAPIGKHRGG